MENIHIFITQPYQYSHLRCQCELWERESMMDRQKVLKKSLGNFNLCLISPVNTSTLLWDGHTTNIASEKCMIRQLIFSLNHLSEFFIQKCLSLL